MTRMDYVLLGCWALSVLLIPVIHLDYSGHPLLIGSGYVPVWRTAALVSVCLLQGLAALVAPLAAQPRKGSRLGYWVLLLVFSGFVFALSFPYAILTFGMAALLIAPAFSLAVVGTVFRIKQKLG